MMRHWLLVFCLALTPALRAADMDVDAQARRIDEQIARAWDKDVKPAGLADDAEFIRRLTLDLAGRIPSVTEARDFIDDERPNKRRLWTDRILDGGPDEPPYKGAYVRHFTNVWRAWLLAQTGQAQQFQQPALEAWLRQRLKANVGYDKLVRDLLTQSAGNPGNPVDGSAAVYYQANENKPENLAGSAARLFLGVKIECAQCHDHPFDSWTRNQFWQTAAFFTDLAQQGPPQGRPAGKRGEIKVPGKSPGEEKIIRARFLDGKEPRWKDETGTRPTLAEWMTTAENPFFARAAVNRLWSYFFGVPLAAPAESRGEEPPAAHKELLDEMARQFTAHNFDVKFLVRAITASQAYQRTSALTDPSQKSPRLFARMPVRGLSPEQFFDSLAEATEFDGGVSANPQGFFRATQSARGQFLARFTAQEKIDYQTSILQALYLMNNEFIADRTSMEKNRTLATLAQQRTSVARKIESLYLVVLSRKPRPTEAERFVKYVEKGGPAGDPKKALADVFWVLLNSPEFILNH